MASQLTGISVEERKRLLQREIESYLRSGYHVVSQTDTTAQMVKPKVFSFVWAFLWFLVFGVGVIVYILYYISKKDQVGYIEVDQFGRVRRF
jgi:hypothetical protein